MSGVKLPDDEPQEPGKELPGTGEAYITNPYPGVEMLTREQALNAINALSGMLLIDGVRRSETSSWKHR